MDAGFRTDTDISRSTPLGQERPLQPWSNDAFSSGGGGDTDLDTFGSGPSLGGNHGSKKTWDQFAENEKRFGTRSDFDEELYTTRLDRSGKDFREKERRAERLANEILGVCSFFFLFSFLWLSFWLMWGVYVGLVDCFLQPSSAGGAKSGCSGHDARRRRQVSDNSSDLESF